MIRLVGDEPVSSFEMDGIGGLDERLYVAAAAGVWAREGAKDRGTSRNAEMARFGLI